MGSFQKMQQCLLQMHGTAWNTPAGKMCTAFRPYVDGVFSKNATMSPTDAWNRLKYTCSWEYVLRFADMQRGGTENNMPSQKCNKVSRMRLDDCWNSHFPAITSLLRVIQGLQKLKKKQPTKNLTYFLQPISGESRMDGALGGRLRHFCAVQLMFESNHAFCMLSNQAISVSTILAFLYWEWMH